jgi:type I restriction enzyme S subunit
MNEDLKDILPKSWEVERLGDFVITEKGKKPKNISNEYNDICHLPYVNIKAFEKNIIDEYTDGLGCVLCEKGDFVMVWDGSRSGYVGKATKGALGSTLVRIKFPGIYLDYAYYFLQSKYLEINTRAKGVGIPHVDPALLWNYHFPIPPLPEQHRIVAKIEELFSSLGKGIESLKTAQQQLKVYRQAVLKWAFEKSSKDKRIRLIDACDFITKGTTPSKDKLFSQKGEIPFLKVYNLTFDGSLDFSIDPAFVSVETHTGFLSRSKVFPGDVLMNIVGPPLGKVSIVPDTFPEWNINQAIARFRCKKSLVNKYLSYFLLSESTIRKYSRKAKATVGQFNLTLEICRDIIMPLPSLREQNAIVAEIESRLSVCDKIEESIEHSLKQSEALRQSILKKAFAGKLVPQNPLDEPASVLLERIRQERSATLASNAKARSRT